MDAHTSDQDAPGGGHGSLINFDIAASTAARLAPAGPVLSGHEIGAAVANLRTMADRSVPYVHDITGLEAARDLRDSQVLIVDRASWAKANTQSFSVLMRAPMEKLAKKQAASLKPGSVAVGGAVTGAQLGSVLAFLSSKVLGQYDPFAALDLDPNSAGSGFPGGRLLLVAPNIVTVERELNVDPSDFRLWVCLHEQTHRVQFAAAPWLRHHMLTKIDQLSSLLMGNAENLTERLASAARSLTGKTSPGKALTGPDAGLSGGAGPHDGAPSRGGILDLLQDPAEKAALSHLTAIMSLLEGHANVVMDAVDASIVPTVRTIRQRFNARGKDRGAVEKFIRNLLGLDAKMRQYSDGARFVRAVVAKVGMEGFNRVWTSEDHLPTEQEIHQPELWVDRMGL
ncbi:zinc-dependent metalloprotease [Paenarthrobacter sp. Z7-10]|uniref:zinc-dependent metalloprotease n=1 Tax=Paenarthrobacter sp. Z7-10 TaxID=2787635 RepID=UPI0022A8DE6E|nr:zinc-dependent metalloprotease [Paenarthrobacter sp. Z7-10]MCZ2401947.1 zinc-dependent metalloprotease [Paenarthrobacter sp. Z7-10]